LRPFSTRHACAIGGLRNITDEHEGAQFIVLREPGDVIDQFGPIARGIEDRDFPSFGVSLLAEWFDRFAKLRRHNDNPSIRISVAREHCNDGNKSEVEEFSHEGDGVTASRYLK
jgi:hypothetical protein